MSSILSSSEVASAKRVRRMVLTDRRFARTFEHPCSIEKVWWKSFASNSAVGCKVLGLKVRPLEDALNVNRVVCLARVVHMSIERSPPCTQLSDPGSGWEMLQDGQWMTWSQGVRNINQ